VIWCLLLLGVLMYMFMVLVCLVYIVILVLLLWSVMFSGGGELWGDGLKGIVEVWCMFLWNCL